MPGDVHQPHRWLRVRPRRRRVRQPEDEARWKVLALRILPGVDVLETRWSAAKVAFDKAKVDVVGVEFTDGDPAKTKKIVDDYIQRYGTIDGVWMDAGAVAVAAVEAFQDAGKPVPPMNGEDQLDFLKIWKDKQLTAIAPTYPTYQWRTPIIAALRILDGEQVSSPGSCRSRPSPRTTWTGISTRTCRRCTTRCAAAPTCPVTRSAGSRSRCTPSASTLVWASPVDDKALAELIPRIAAFGFDAVELPIEQPGDWDPARTRDLLAEHGLVAAGVCAVTRRGGTW
ncbi:substrate-binding domain-containing protein [Micromonospora sp. M12]